MVCLTGSQRVSVPTKLLRGNVPEEEEEIKWERVEDEDEAPKWRVYLTHKVRKLNTGRTLFETNSVNKHCSKGLTGR